MVKIAYLSDYPDYVGNVSRWLYDAFIHSDDDDETASRKDIL